MRDDLALCSETSKSVGKRSVKCLDHAVLMYESRLIYRSVSTDNPADSSIACSSSSSAIMTLMYSLQTDLAAAPLHQFLAASFMPNLDRCQLLSYSSRAVKV